jgi:hypothetical protein
MCELEAVSTGSGGVKEEDVFPKEQNALKHKFFSKSHPHKNVRATCQRDCVYYKIISFVLHASSVLGPLTNDCKQLYCGVFQHMSSLPPLAFLISPNEDIFFSECDTSLLSSICHRDNKNIGHFMSIPCVFSKDQR